MTRVIVALFAGLLTLGLVSLAVGGGGQASLAITTSTPTPASAPGSVALVAVDVDTAGNEPNGPLGPVDSCREVTAGETFTIDVIVDSISPADGLAGFSFALRYSPGLELVSYAIEDRMIGQDPDSFVISLTEELPDLDGILSVGAADFAQPPADESGTGVLLRLEVRKEGPANGYIELIHLFFANSSLQELGVESVRNAVIIADGTCAESAADPDGDGVCSPGLSSPACTGEDNCPGVANPDQADADGDGDGDACDECPSVPSFGDFDGDQDGVFNACDNCYGSPTSDQTDSDGDGIGDECDFLDIEIADVDCPSAVDVEVVFTCAVKAIVTNEKPLELLAFADMLWYTEGSLEGCMPHGPTELLEQLTLAASESREIVFSPQFSCAEGGNIFLTFTAKAGVIGVPYAARVNDHDGPVTVTIVGPSPTLTPPPVTTPPGATPGPTVPGGKGGDAPPTPSPSPTATPQASLDGSAAGGGALTPTPAAFPATGGSIAQSGWSYGLTALSLAIGAASVAVGAARRRR